ncbi:MAG: UDP-N-acetylmuramate dehydrogenase [Bacteroidota bacterium]
MIRENTSLQAYNTFGISAKAAYFTAIDSESDLLQLLPIRLPLLILGGGSNVLFTKDWHGLVLKNNIKGIEKIDETDDFTWLSVGAGEVWHELVLHTIAQNLGGIENLSLIPGTVGAAPIQNIGAYGVELKDVLVSVRALHLETGDIRIFHKEDCVFGYRESIFKTDLKGQYIITNVVMRFRKNPTVFNTNYGDIQKILANKNSKTPTLRDVSNAVIAIRESKLPDPKVLGNCGSFFKNPEILRTHFAILIEKHPSIPSFAVANPDYVKVPAGWLIEQAGWKGRRVGNTGSHAQQALVLVNYGDATGEEVKNLAFAIIQDVFEKFGVKLIAEVNMM